MYYLHTNKIMNFVNILYIIADNTKKKIEKLKKTSIKIIRIKW